MTALSPFVERNRAFAATGATAGLTVPAATFPVLILTCLDPRTDPAAFLGLQLADAPVVRNAGGRVTRSFIDELAFLTVMIGPATAGMAVAVIHHTGCGTGLLADAGIRRQVAARTGQSDADLAAMAVTDPAATVAADVETLLAAPQLPDTLRASGHVLDLSTGLVRTVVEERSRQGAAR